MPKDLPDLKCGRFRKATAERIEALFGLTISEGTLANKASDGSGPAYRLVMGRAFYLDADVDEWVRSQISAPTRKASQLHGQQSSEVAA